MSMMRITVTSVRWYVFFTSAASAAMDLMFDSMVATRPLLATSLP